MPAYHAGRTLELTVNEIPRDVVDDVLLIDDASQDGTVDVARRLGLTTFVHPRNLGYGANHKTCYKEALGLGAHIVVMLHPDYQYSPRPGGAMAHMVASGHYDVGFWGRASWHRAPRPAGCRATSTWPTAASPRCRIS